tara:strand:- start:2080 stop:2679 length:600 start_codon:yes stop_codon:yes gene_type:complete
MKKNRITSALPPSESRKLNKRLQKEIKTRASKAVEHAKTLMLREFDSHPITKEINAGPAATNSSGTLGGKGNLFSFIGFSKGDKPIREVRSLLENSTKLIGIRKSPHGKIGFQIVIDLPNKEEIKNASPLPWAAARSWVIGIEQGLSGLGQYLVKSGAGRSGGGIEIKGQINSGRFRNTKYVSAILANLQSNLMKFLKS